MTLGPAAPPGTTAGFPHRLGPWVIAHGAGAAARRCAEGVREEADRRGFDTKALTTAQTARLHLDRYKSVIIVPPSEGLDGDQVALLQPSVDLAGGYRARRPDGLRALRAGRVDASEAGVLQVVAAQELLQAPEASVLVEHACATHIMSEDPLVDAEQIFQAYEMEIPGLPQTTSVKVANREVLRLWARAQEWGLKTVADVEIVLELIEERRPHYNYDARHGLRRPLGDGIPRSRYDFILDPPHKHSGQETSEYWAAEGAEVVREVVLHIRSHGVPTFENPKRTKGSTERFSRFYGEMRTLRDFLQHTPTIDLIVFPAN